MGERSGAFQRTLHTRFPIEVAIAAAAITLVAFVGLAVLAPQGVTNGDAALYSQQITEGSTGELAIHLGYYWLGRLFTAVVPGSADFALNLMSALLVAGSAGLVALIAYVLTGRLTAALGAPAVLLAHQVVAANAIAAEVYGPQLFFFLACVLFTLLERPIPAGLAFGWAFLITPSTALALPFIVLLRPQLTFLWKAALAALAPIALILTPHLVDFLSGDRGLLGAAGDTFSAGAALGKEWREVRTLYVLGVFVVFGVYVFGVSKRHRLFAIGLALLWVLQFFPGEKYADVPVQLPLYGMLAVLGGVGLARLLHLTRANGLALAMAIIFVAAVGISAYLSYPAVADDAKAIDAYRDAVLEMGDARAPDAIAIAGWSPGFVAEHYLAQEAQTLDWVNTDDLAGYLGIEARDEARARVEAAFATGSEIWLLGPLGQGVYDVLASAGYQVSQFSPQIGVARPLGMMAP